MRVILLLLVLSVAGLVVVTYFQWVAVVVVVAVVVGLYGRQKGAEKSGRVIGKRKRGSRGEQ